MVAGLLVALGLLALVAWAVCRIGAYADREEAQRNLVGLVAEQADERVIADNLDV